MGIALTERMVFNEIATNYTYLAMILILLGNSVTVPSDVQFHAIGFSSAFFSVIMNVSCVVSMRCFLKSGMYSKL